jgi:UDP-N-acetylmuramate--alanine ligase
VTGPNQNPAALPARLRIRDAHLVGIGGSGMRALAELMRDVGVRVTGSDAALRDDDRWRMHLNGLRVCAGHAARHLPDEADLLVYSPAVPADNPERQAALRIGIPQLSLPQALGWLMRSRMGISVAGTHGKTTTTALLGHLLEDAGLSPSVVCGGEVRERGASGWAGRGRALVVESCEYRRHFLELHPRHAILLNIEPDHFDCFGSLHEAIDAYAQFVATLPPRGTLVVNADCPAALQAAGSARCRVVTVGTSPAAEWHIAQAARTRSGWSFLVEHRGRHFARFRLPSPVKHNVLNALAAVALARRLGVRRHLLQAGLRTFAGVRRRFESIGSIGGVTLIDDYAHHPTAIAGVLQAVRRQYPGARLWCAFQPHQVSRTQALQEEFARSLALADVVLIAPVFAAREQAGAEAVNASRRLAARTAELGVQTRFVASLDEIRRTVETEPRPGDVFLTLGAGDIDSIPRSYARLLAQPRAG